MSYKLYIETPSEQDRVRTFEDPNKAVEAGVKFVPESAGRITDEDKNICVVQLIHWDETILYQDAENSYRVRIERVADNGVGPNLELNGGF